VSTYTLCKKKNPSKTVEQALRYVVENVVYVVGGGGEVGGGGDQRGGKGGER